jgi:hypothetical protein
MSKQSGRENAWTRRDLVAKPAPIQTQRGMFWYDIVWIALLVLAAIACSVQPALTWLPHRSLSFETVVPLWVPWAGALGGATISLVGVASHAVTWDHSRFGYWHLTRPFLGAVSGTISVLIVVLVLNTVTPPSVDERYTAAGKAVLAVISFVVGFRERTFRELITKVVDVILASGGTAAANPVALVPSLVDFGDVTGGSPVERTASLFNGGADTIRVAGSAVSVEGSTEVVATATDADLDPGSAMPVRLTWTPTGTGALAATLVVTAEARRVTALLRGISS